MSFLKQLRDNNDWSQEDLAGIIGKSRSLVNNIENSGIDGRLSFSQAVKLGKETNSNPLILQWATNDGLESEDVKKSINQAIKKLPEDPEDLEFNTEDSEPIADQADLFFEMLTNNLNKKLNQKDKKRKEQLNNYEQEHFGPWPYDYGIPFINSTIQNEIFEDILNEAIETYFSVYKENYPQVWNNAQGKFSGDKITINELFDLINEMEQAALETEPTEEEPATNKERREGIKVKAREELTVNDLVDVIKDKTKKESRDIPRIVLNSQERQSLVENLSVNDKCPLEPESLKTLSTKELKGLKDSLEITDYSARNTMNLGQSRKEKPPKIVLNQANEGD